MIVEVETLGRNTSVVLDGQENNILSSVAISGRVVSVFYNEGLGLYDIDSILTNEEIMLESSAGGLTFNVDAILVFDKFELQQELLPEPCNDIATPITSDSIFVCGENISSHKPVVLLDNKAYVMSNTNMDHRYSFIGFSKTSGVPGGNIEVVKGRISLDCWGLIPNQVYLVGSNGSLITNNSTSGTFTKVIGFAESSNTLLIYEHYSPIVKN